MTENLRRWPVEEMGSDAIGGGESAQLGWKWWKFFMIWLLPNSFAFIMVVVVLCEMKWLWQDHAATADKGRHACYTYTIVREKKKKLWGAKGMLTEVTANCAPSLVHVAISTSSLVFAYAIAVLMLSLFCSAWGERERGRGRGRLNWMWYVCTLYESVCLQL